MYFRTKHIKGSALLQLVESFRNADGNPRQRVIASLGDAALPVGKEKQIAKAVERRLRGDSNWFEEEMTAEITSWVTLVEKAIERSKTTRVNRKATTLDGVLVGQIETDNVVQLGSPLVAQKAWDELGLSSILEDGGMSPSAIASAQLLVYNRLIEPMSEWALIDWSYRTALPELLDLRVTKTSKDRLYRASDLLLDQRERIEKTLRGREKDLFSLRRSLVLYDVTNTHFEGLCRSNPKAKHGKNKQKRNDCRQVSVGMAFDEYGFPLAHEVFEGNMADTSTLRTMLERLDHKEMDGTPVVILDAGFASEANLQLLKDLGYSYLINVTRSSRTKYAEHFVKEEFVPIPGRSADQQVEVKTIIDPDDENQKLLLCRSAQRRLKEQAMMSNAESRFLKDAEALKARIEKGQLKQIKTIYKHIGSLQKKHPRVRRFYDVEHQNDALVITRHDEKMDEALSLCGDYVLKTDQRFEATTLWELYMSLLKAETGFRMLKSSLGLRPNYHQLETRVDGHIFISVLAYHLLSWIRYKQEQAGDLREWKTIRRILSTHSLVTTRLPLKDGRIVSIRKASIPDAEQTLIYAQLGIDWKKAFTPIQTEIKTGTTL